MFLEEIVSDIIFTLINEIIIIFLKASNFLCLFHMPRHTLWKVVMWTHTQTDVFREHECRIEQPTRTTMIFVRTPNHPIIHLTPLTQSGYMSSDDISFVVWVNLSVSEIHILLHLPEKCSYIHTCYNFNTT